MIELDQNTGIILETKETDFLGEAIAGYSKLPYEANILYPNWQIYESIFEYQKKYDLESMACVSFSANKVIQCQINRALEQNLIKPEFYAFLKANNFLELNHIGLECVNFSDRFTAKMSGTGPRGNTLGDVANSIKKNGLIAERNYGWTGPFNWDEYYKEISTATKELAKEILKYIDISYEFIYTGQEKDVNVIAKQLLQAPLQIATPTCPGWNEKLVTDGKIGYIGPVVKSCSRPVNHATALISLDINSGFYVISDQYDPRYKRLSLDYPIPWVFKILVNFK